MKTNWQQTVVMSFLGLSLVLSGVGVVYVKHATREMYSELNMLQTARDDLNNEWTQLLLEQSTLATDGRVDLIAHQTLKMHPPKNDEVIWVKR